MYKCKNKKPLLMIIETNHGQIFGSFISTELVPSNSNDRKYYGNGETFIFSLKPEIQKYAWNTYSSNNFYGS